VNVIEKVTWLGHSQIPNDIDTSHLTTTVLLVCRSCPLPVLLRVRLNVLLLGIILKWLLCVALS